MAAVFKPSAAGSPVGGVVYSLGEGLRRSVSWLYALALMAGRSGSRNERQWATGAPLKVQSPNKSMADSEPVAPAGVSGLPNRSTEGLALLAFAGSTPGK